MEEKTVATISESQLMDDVDMTTEIALGISVTNKEEFEYAANACKVIMRKAALVKDFFKPMKENANALHKDICRREKALLEPLDAGHNAIKKEMGRYLGEQEKARLEAEKRAEEARRAEAERLAAIAIEAEEQGNRELADAALDEAEMVESTQVSVRADRPKVNGVTTIKEYKVVVVNCHEVPDVFEGVEIRPIDNAALERIARLHKGNIDIPGCLVQVSEKVVVRSK